MPKHNNLSAQISAKKFIEKDAADSAASSKKIKKEEASDSKISRFNPVEIYRTYGKTKREYSFIEYLKLFLARGVVVIMMFAMLSILATGFVAFLVFGNILVSAVVMFAMIVILFVKFSKPIRRRLKFQKKLKKLCREKRYKLTFEQSFIDSLFWSPEKLDFTLNTGTHLYLVHYLTLPKYNASLTFMDSENFVYTKHRLRNPFTLIFDLKDKSKNYSVKFPEKYVLDRKKTVKAIIVNPVCRDIFRKNENGSIEATGSGGDIFGASVFTGTGFLENVRRNEEFSKEKINY